MLIMWLIATVSEREVEVEEERVVAMVMLLVLMVDFDDAQRAANEAQFMKGDNTKIQKYVKHNSNRLNQYQY